MALLGKLEVEALPQGLDLNRLWPLEVPRVTGGGFESTGGQSQLIVAVFKVRGIGRDAIVEPEPALGLGAVTAKA